ncbi:hypothetical protein BOX15_Mlig016736g2, partial [Macrostomum lignano]
QSMSGRIIVGAIVLVVSVGASVYYYLRSRRPQAQAQAQGLSLSLSSSSRGDTKEVSEQLQCVVCLDRERNIMLQPCNHFCLCDACHQRLKRRVCPICNRPIASVLPVFVS